MNFTPSVGNAGVFGPNHSVVGRNTRAQFVDLTSVIVKLCDSGKSSRFAASEILMTLCVSRRSFTDIKDGLSEAVTFFSSGTGNGAVTGHVSLRRNHHKHA